MQAWKACSTQPNVGLEGLIPSRNHGTHAANPKFEAALARVYTLARLAGRAFRPALTRRVFMTRVVLRHLVLLLTGFTVTSSQTLLFAQTFQVQTRLAASLPGDTWEP